MQIIHNLGDSKDGPELQEGRVCPPMGERVVFVGEPLNFGCEMSEFPLFFGGRVASLWCCLRDFGEECLESRAL